MEEKDKLREIDNYLSAVSVRLLDGLLNDMVAGVGGPEFWTAARRAGELLDLRRNLRDLGRSRTT